jgi:hypothetical protein
MVFRLRARGIVGQTRRGARHRMFIGDTPEQTVGTSWPSASVRSSSTLAGDKCPGPLLPIALAKDREPASAIEASPDAGARANVAGWPLVLLADACELASAIDPQDFDAHRRELERRVDRLRICGGGEKCQPEKQPSRGRTRARRHRIVTQKPH